jgi:MoxR-like ATPases
MVDPKRAYESVIEQVRKRISGKEEVLKLMFISLVADGHALLEGVPGVAKTTMAKAMADAVQADFGRVQGTSDLEFKDIVGYTYVDSNHQVQVKRGPIFTNILLIDELNRAPQRTASALLEALEERQVTLGDSTIPLKRPFIAFATQNPLNVEGTIPIPKVLADRFLMRIEVGYPSVEEEIEMLRIKEKPVEANVERVLSISDILEMQKMVSEIKVSEEILKYITNVVNQTRVDIHVVMGGSPRAEISFLKAGKARAMIEGRNEVSMDDIKKLARPILSHRIVVRSTGGIGVNGIIDGIIATT